MSDLIDTTEMYLRTIFELTEEGVLPMRARIAERLSQSGPTVSQTVARMERDGLLVLDREDRHLELTDEGAALATRVMRKHRLAERLLVDVIGLPWEQVHAEACRWEHVMSEDVERRLVALLGHPTISPFGNPIPGLDELGEVTAPGTSASDEQGAALAAVAAEGDPQVVTILRFGEPLQSDEAVMADLRRIGAIPGGSVPVVRVADRVRIGTDPEIVELSVVKAVQITVAAP